MELNINTKKWGRSYRGYTALPYQSCYFPFFCHRFFSAFQYLFSVSESGLLTLFKATQGRKNLSKHMKRGRPMEGRGFKELSVTPCSHQNRDQRVSCKPGFRFHQLPPADSILVPEVVAAMLRAAFFRVNGGCVDNLG